MKVDSTCPYLYQAFLEYIRDEQIPPEVADVFKAARIKYYDGATAVNYTNGSLFDCRGTGPSSKERTAEYFLSRRTIHHAVTKLCKYACRTCRAGERTASSL
jgi:hypothetical protein